LYRLAESRTLDGQRAMNDQSNDSVTRRQVLAAAVAGPTLGALPGCEPTSAQAQPQPHPEQGRPRAATARMPVVYLPHGGGPWPFIDMGLGDRDEQDQLKAYLRSLAALPPLKPQALVVVSAHWEAPVPTVMTGARPPLYFDYYGFPPESYKLTWPAPGHPAVAARVQQLLGAAGLASATDGERGFDHGTFVPLKLTYPEADVPTVQLSLKQGLDPAEHLAIGRALAPLREEGVFLVGSGMSYHNMRGFGPHGRPAAAAFDAWLNEAIAQPPDERARRLSRWADAPSARQAHPREEHLLPLMVIAGAAGADVGRTAYNSTLMGLRLSAFHFG
jgi:aromatic ring-opening dioxygenase catalytic subunit (LigB family)